VKKNKRSIYIPGFLLCKCDQFLDVRRRRLKVTDVSEQPILPSSKVK